MLKLNLASCVFLLLPAVGLADAIVVPNANTSSPGNTVLSGPASGGGIYQELFGQGQFPGDVEITGISFRPAIGSVPVDWEFDTLDVYLSSKILGGPISTTFANNTGPDNTLVFSAANFTLSDAGCSGPAVCAFDLNVVLTTPFIYSPEPGKPLVVEYVYTSTQNPTGFADGEVFRSFPSPIAQVSENGSSSGTTGTLAFGGLITEFSYTPVPEPASWMLLLGVASLLWMARKRGWQRISSGKP